ncbi:MAG: hypothetical protein ACI8RZ_002764 [Myxococcota bacterium]|jgi:hypothetical protein
MRGPGKGTVAKQRENSQYSRTRRRKQIREEERQRRQEQERRERERLWKEEGDRELSPGVSDRYTTRQARFVQRHGRSGRVWHAGAWLVHNCIAHPLLGLKPGATTLRIHDRTADWLNLAATPSRSEPPQLGRRRDWLVHNCIAHPLMGLAPATTLFHLHDTTAEDMGVPGWI